MNNLKGHAEYTGIAFRPHNWVSTKATMHEADNGQLSNTDSRAQQNPQNDDQICLTRLTDRGVETVSTGVTKSMIESCIQESATEEMWEKVKGMLDIALNDDLRHTWITDLGILGKLLYLSENFNLIKKILQSNSLSINDLNKALNVLEASNLLRDKKITPELLGEILLSKSPDLTLKRLNQYPELLKITPELWKIILKYGTGNGCDVLCPSDVLKVLVDQPALLDNEKLTLQLWEKILALKSICLVQFLPELLEKLELKHLDKLLSLNNLNLILEVGKKLLKRIKITPKFSNHLDQILSSSSPLPILKTLTQHPELLKNKKITTEFLNTILLLDNPIEALETLAKYPELLINEKITTEFLNLILFLDNPIEALEILAKYPELAQHPELLKKEILTTELLRKILASKLLNKILSSKDPLSIIIFLKEHPELLNPKKIAPKLWDPILALNDPVYVLKDLLNNLNEDQELPDTALWPLLASLLNLPSSLIKKILTSTDPGGILDALRNHPQLLNSQQLTPECLEKIVELNHASGILKSLDTCLVQYPNILILNMPSDTFAELAERLIYLVLREDSRVNDILSQINNQVNIQDIKIQLNNIINSEIEPVIQELNDLKTISNPIFFQLERSKKIAQLLINEAGELNFFLIDQLKEKMPTSVSPAHDKEFNETLDNLKNNKDISTILTSINIPRDPRNKANAFIRATFQLDIDAHLTLQLVRQATLSALLMNLRQSSTGSCFTTAVAIRIHSTQQDRFLQDMKDMIENGYTTRSVNGIEYKLFWSAIPSDQNVLLEGYLTRKTTSMWEKKIFAALQVLGYHNTWDQTWENYKTYNIKRLIEQLAAEKLGITQEAIDERSKLEELPQPDEKAIPILSSRIKLIDPKFDAFDKLVNHALFCFHSVSKNLLLRGWEYGIGAPGSRTADEKLSKSERSHASPRIYDLLWGLDTDRCGGINQTLMDLTKEILNPHKSQSEIKSIQRQLHTTFQHHFEKLFAERVKQQYQHGGFSLYETSDLTNLNEIPMISPLSNPIELQDLLGRLILETGFKLQNDFESEDAPLIIKITTKLSQLVRSDAFLEYFIRIISQHLLNMKVNVIPLELTEKIPEIKNLKTRFGQEFDGGQPTPILKVYYESSDIKPVKFIANNAEDLLIKLITALKKMKIEKDQKVLLPISGGRHAYLLMPNHPSFRSAIDSDLEPKEWVKQHVYEQNKTIVFADTNWEKDGTHKMFAISKNKKEEVVFLTFDEMGNAIAGVDEFGEEQESMNQDKWVNNQSFDLFTDLP